MHVDAYDEEVANIVAKAWTHRVSYFHAAVVEVGRPDVMDWAPILASYEEPVELRALDDGATPQLRRRLTALRKTRPH